MAPIPPLFTIPIGSSSEAAVVATQPADRVYLLTFNSPPDNRMTPDFIAALTLALDIVEHKLPRGVVVTTSAIPKFYSNGLDFEAAIATPKFFENSFNPLLRRFLSYPMPTIALMPGHAFAGGLMLAMAHDYRVMNPAKGYACLNELDFGAAMRPGMAGLFRTKVAPTVYRSLALEARRFGSKDALADGIVDALGGWEAVEKLVVERKLTTKADMGVYGATKEELYREEIAFLDASEDKENDDVGARVEHSQGLSAKAEDRVAEWEKKGGKIAEPGASAKL